MTRRFTVSLHKVGEAFTRDGDHLDWFFQKHTDPSSPLATFSTSVGVGLRMQEASRIVIPATPLPDHRAEYLDYDGEVSGDRGSVRRLMTGCFELVSKADERTNLLLNPVEIFDPSLLVCQSNHRINLVFVGRDRINDSLQ